MLGKFPRYTFHVGRLPGKDVPILTEEVDERAFLFGIQVHANGGGLAGISFNKFHMLGLYGGLEYSFRVRNLLLRSRHLRSMDLGLDLLELLTVEDCFSEGGFTKLALPCLGEASVNGDDVVWSGNLELVIDKAWPCEEGV